MCTLIDMVYSFPLSGISANFALHPFHWPHPLSNPPLEGEGILWVTFLTPPLSRGRLGEGWGEGSSAVIAIRVSVDSKFSENSLESIHRSMKERNIFFDRTAIEDVSGRQVVHRINDSIAAFHQPGNIGFGYHFLDRFYLC